MYKTAKCAKQADSVFGLILRPRLFHEVDQGVVPIRLEPQSKVLEPSGWCLQAERPSRRFPAAVGLVNTKARRLDLVNLVGTKLRAAARG